MEKSNAKVAERRKVVRVIQRACEFSIINC